MIRLNVSMTVETEENKKHLKEAAIELVSFSLRDKGCIDYDLYESKTNSDRLMIIETWKDKKALEAHQKSEHFARLAPELQKYASVITTCFEF